MNNNEKTFSPAESLQLIRSMVETARHSIFDSSHYFLLWGWAVMIGCVTQYILLEIVHYPRHYYAWFITLVALALQFWFLFKDTRRQKVKTFVGQATGYLWMAIGFAFIVLSFIFSKIGWQFAFPFYILFYGIGTSVSGGLLRFKPMVVGGSICFVCAAIAPFLPYPLQILLTAFAILVSYIIPGHMLRINYRRQHATSPVR